MYKFLLLLIFFLSILILLTTSKKEKIKYFDYNGENMKNSEVIDEINYNSERIESMYSKLIIKQSLFSTQGFIAFKRPNDFSMICHSIFGKEVEIGLNNKHFWFYSKNIRPKALYYCDSDKIDQTRLKKIFYPSLLIEFLGVNQISKQELKSHEDFVYIEENITISQISFKKIIIIKNNKVDEYKLCNDNNEIILEVKIVEHQKVENIDLPKKIKINWLEESVQQDWELVDTKVNIKLQNWEMPYYKNKINLIDY